jgi:hypothetical protein
MNRTRSDDPSHCPGACPIVKTLVHLIGQQHPDGLADDDEAGADHQTADLVLTRVGP